MYEGPVVGLTQIDVETPSGCKEAKKSLAAIKLRDKMGAVDSVLIKPL